MILCLYFMDNAIFQHDMKFAANLHLSRLNSHLKESYLWHTQSYYKWFLVFEKLKGNSLIASNNGMKLHSFELSF